MLLLHEVQMSKDELRKRIELEPQLKKDLDFLVACTGLRPHQLLTGLWLDCNLMNANQQALLSRETKETWPNSEGTLRQLIKTLRRAARQIQTTNKTEFSPTLTGNRAEKFSGLPELLRDYAGGLERNLNIWVPYWKQRKSRLPYLVSLTRQNSLYERIRSTAGSYHQVRLLRLVNATRVVKGLPKIPGAGFYNVAQSV